MTDDELFAEFEANPPASLALIEQCQAKLSSILPADYVQFLQQMNGGEGFLGKAYVALWRVDELGDRNAGYEVAEFAPGLFLFESNTRLERDGLTDAQKKLPQLPPRSVGRAQRRANRYLC
jgi:hypothetical protein